MKIILLWILTIVLSLGFSGCSTEYINTKYPKLYSKRFQVHIRHKYKVIHGYAQVPVKDLRKCVINCNKSNQINKLLNDEIDDYNNKFIRGK